MTEKLTQKIEEFEAKFKCLCETAGELRRIINEERETLGGTAEDITTTTPKNDSTPFTELTIMPCEIQGRRVKLNVGGKLFSTTLTTLTSVPDSMLAYMFSGRHKIETDEDGYAFIDRNGSVFEYILDFLRDGELLVPSEPYIQKRLLKEAEYYQIQPLITALKGQRTHSIPFAGNLHEGIVDHLFKTHRPSLPPVEDIVKISVSVFNQIDNNKFTDFVSKPDHHRRFNTNTKHGIDFIQITFKTVIICPSAYTVRYSWNNAVYLPRNWSLQGKMAEEAEWKTVVGHANNSQFKTAWQIETFTIPKQENYYDCFRILGGTNANNNTYVMFHCFEIFGEFRYKEGQTPGP